MARRQVLLAAAAALAAAGCGGGEPERAVAGEAAAIRADGPSSTATPTTAPAAVATSTAPATTQLGPPASATATTVPPTRPTAAASTRRMVDQAGTPFATVGGIVLHHPARRVELVGFHESNHEGAQVMAPAATAVAPVDVGSRGRGTQGRTAADVVVQPGTTITSPVTGRVKRAGGYVLYCKHRDHYAVIEPAGMPGIEVKLLHIGPVQVRAGQQVVAGRTAIAPNATQLPFESQVDELRTADPAWPHVHVEVVDTSIKNRPNPGSGGCS